MTRFEGIRRFFRLDRGTKSVTQAVDDELRFHLDASVRQLVASGLSPADADAEARRRFGDLRLARERLAHIDMERVVLERRAEWWGALWQDLRYAARGLRLKPGFTAAVVTTLALGIGANAAMFSVVDRLLFRPPALLKDPSNVHRVYLGQTFDNKEFLGTNTQYRRYLDLIRGSHSFDRSAAFWFTETAVGEGQRAENLTVGAVSASYFGFFDAPPAIGRYFVSAEDTTAGGARVVVLGYGYWQTRFGAHTDVIGQQVRIGARSFEVIGVAPAHLSSVEGQVPVAFVPITTWAEGMDNSRQGYYTTYSMSWMEMLVHLRPGASLSTATSDITAAFRQSYLTERELSPRTRPIESVKPRVVLASVRRQSGPQAGADAKVAIWLSGVAIVVLLVACANVANLLLARSFGRRREIAVRLALGMGRVRLVGQLLTESLLLALVAGVAGLVIAQFGGAGLRAMLLPDVAWTSAFVDPRTLGFTALAAMVVGVLAGLAPVIHAGGHDLAGSLKAGVREGTVQRSRLRVGLLVLQGALSVVLLVGAGLFVRSLQHVRAVPLGWDPPRLLYLTVDFRSVRLNAAAVATLKNQLRERAAAIPGVEFASRGVTVPFWMSWDESIYVPGVDSAGRFGAFQLQTGSPDYFRTVGTRLVRGRGIDESDVASSPLVMVVSQTMARKLWPGSDPLGKCVRIGADTAPCRTVVGLAQDIRRESFGEDPGLQYYLPITQFHPLSGGIFVRTSEDATLRAEAIRANLQRLLPGDAYLTVKPLSQLIDAEAKSWTLGATLFVTFGGLALLLASIGLYSVIAYNVTQRIHEIGVRVALGAQPADVARLVLSQGISLALAGVTLGTAAALWAGKFVKPMLFDQSPHDPAVFATVAATLLSVAIIASLVPAMRAVRVDPVTALRSE